MSTIIILILVGLILAFISINQYRHFKKLLRTGAIAEGVVYSTEASDSPYMTSIYPTIRFITHNEEWITEKYKIGLIPGTIKKGQRVKVVYNPINPSEFVLDTPLLAPFIVIVGIAGTALVGIGIFKLLHI